MFTMIANWIGDRGAKAAIASIAKESPSVITAGLKAMGKVVLKHAKTLVPKSIKPHIGSGFARKKKPGERTMRVGGAVGVTSSKAKKASAKSQKRKAANRGGVGISARNVHWWLMGTKQRQTKKTKANRGIMPGQPKIMQQAWNKSRSEAMRAMMDAVKKQLAKKAAQAARKG